MEQKGLPIPKTVKIPVTGAMWIVNPVGSQYKDPDSKTMVTRQETTLQYAKSGIPQKWQFSKTDLDNMIEFFESKTFDEVKKLLPEQITLEPNSV